GARPGQASDQPVTMHSAGHRPPALIAAGIVTLVGSVPVLLVCGFNALFALVAPDSYAQILSDSAFLSDSLDQLGMSADSFVQIVAIFCSVAAVASVLGIIASAALLLNRRWGLWSLRILAFFTIAIGLLGFPVGLLWSAAAVAVVVLLFRP